MKKTVALLFLSTMLAACTSSLNVLVDNPLDSEIKVVIDEKTHVIPPLGSKLVEVGKGNHVMTYKNDRVEFDIEGYMINMDFEIVLNPTRSAYISKEKIFSVTELDFATIEHRLPLDTVRVLNVMSLIGNYRRVTDPVIISHWEYGLGEEFPDSVVGASNANYKIVIKFAREQDFFNSLIKRPVTDNAVK
jgi:hypothetical protein